MVKMEIMEEPKRKLKVKYQKEPGIEDTIIHHRDSDIELSPEEYELAINSFKAEKLNQRLKEEQEMAQNQAKMQRIKQFMTPRAPEMAQNLSESGQNPAENQAFMKEYLKSFKILVWLWVVFVAFFIAFNIFGVVFS